MVPIEADAERNRLVVACAAPLPRLELSVLRALVTATVEPLLVGDDAAAALLEAYGTAPAQAARVTRAVSLQRRRRAHRAGDRDRPRQPGAARALRTVGVGRPRRRHRAEEIVLPSRAVRVPHPVVNGRLVTKEGVSWLAAPTAH